MRAHLLSIPAGNNDCSKRSPTFSQQLSQSLDNFHDCYSSAGRVRSTVHPSVAMIADDYDLVSNMSGDHTDRVPNGNDSSVDLIQEANPSLTESAV